MAISIADSFGSPTRRLSFLPEPEKPPPAKLSSMWHRLVFGRWLNRDDSRTSSPPADVHRPHGSRLTRKFPRRVGVGLPRPGTFKRQNSERRDRLTPVDPRRALSAGHRRALSTHRTRSPPPNAPAPRLSAPEVPWHDDSLRMVPSGSNDGLDALGGELSRFGSTTCGEDLDEPDGREDSLDVELERKWILNLSMQFRDKSHREKFFVTYAEAANRWRRVTISCDYRGALPDSLEQDLKELHYQSDKSARIYESIRESLPEIQFYDTVTNLKLETIDGRLHVHVTEDVNEIIPYPPVSSVGHLDAKLVPEYRLNFDAHLSGFVYKVRIDGKVYIKKEIPGPDTVEEFLYELNALHDLKGSRSVIQFGGVVVDDTAQVVKGLLIGYAERGPLVEMLYDHRGRLPWPRRERWARQIVQGLCEIHEAGYVQGDFTLSNIVIDSNDDAKIIDINRRGCPVGWEPPEMAAKIESNQRISMYIGVKSDLFQLGMTLWALAMEEDEPERQSHPLVLDANDAKVPEYYRSLVSICLSPHPQDRLSAKELLSLFPPEASSVPDGTVPDPWMSNGALDNNSPRRHSLTFSQDSDPPEDLQASKPEEFPVANVMYVTPANFLGSMDPPMTALLDYSPRGRQPSTHTLPLNGYPPPAISPSRERSPGLSFSQQDYYGPVVSDDPDPEPPPKPIYVEAPYFEEPKDTFKSGEPPGRRSHTPTLRHTGDLQRALSSNRRATVPPVSGGLIQELGTNLDVTMDPIRRGSRPGNRSDFGRFQMDSLLGNLTGVGGHPACSLGQPGRLAPLDRSLVSGKPPFSQPKGHEPGGSKSSSSLPSESPGTQTPAASRTESQTSYTSSLLDSRLPINPAFIQSPARRVERPWQRAPFATSSLLDSILPINPALRSGTFSSSSSDSSVLATLAAKSRTSF